jgi:hypothetical protein
MSRCRISVSGFATAPENKGSIGYTFSIAHNQPSKQDGQWTDETIWYTVELGSSEYAEKLAAKIQKGDFVTADGNYFQKTTPNGKKYNNIRKAEISIAPRSRQAHAAADDYQEESANPF